MMPEGWSRIKEIVQTAADLGPDAGRQYLDRECAGDESLKAEVVFLRSQQEQGGRVLDGSSSPTPALSPGSLLAQRFKILKRRGHGAMGEVYQAEDLELHGIVALKIISSKLAH